MYLTYYVRLDVIKEMIVNISLYFTYFKMQISVTSKEMFTI